MNEYIEREAFLKEIEERYCLPCKEEGKTTTAVGAALAGWTICAVM